MSAYWILISVQMEGVRICMERTNVFVTLDMKWIQLGKIASVWSVPVFILKFGVCFYRLLLYLQCFIRSTICFLILLQTSFPKLIRNFFWFPVICDHFITNWCCSSMFWLSTVSVLIPGVFIKNHYILLWDKLSKSTLPVFPWKQRLQPTLENDWFDQYEVFWWVLTSAMYSGASSSPLSLGISCLNSLWNYLFSNTCSILGSKSNYNSGFSWWPSTDKIWLITLLLLVSNGKVLNAGDYISCYFSYSHC